MPMSSRTSSRSRPRSAARSSEVYRAREPAGEGAATCSSGSIPRRRRSPCSRPRRSSPRPELQTRQLSRPGSRAPAPTSAARRPTGDHAARARPPAGVAWRAASRPASDYDDAINEVTQGARRRSPTRARGRTMPRRRLRRAATSRRSLRRSAASPRRGSISRTDGPRPVERDRRQGRPAAGRADRRSPACRMLSIVHDKPAWVEANFKETDLAKMAVGQPAEVSFDAYPGAEAQRPRRQHRRRHRQRILGASGAERERQLGQGHPARAGAHRVRREAARAPMIAGLSADGRRAHRRRTLGASAR